LPPGHPDHERRDDDEEDVMACPRITLHGVTAEVWDCLRQRAASLGINFPPGDAGTVHHPQGDAHYAWDEVTHTLAVTFTRTPSWISCNDIEARIRHAAWACGAS
jgi:hypothetical protein